MKWYILTVIVLTTVTVALAADHTITLTAEQENALAYAVEQENHRRGDPDVGVNPDIMVQLIIDADLANVGRNMNALIATPAEITKSPALTDRLQVAAPQPGPSVLTAPQATPKPTPKGKKP